LGCHSLTTVADSYLAAASHAAGAVAKQAADTKSLKYSELSATYDFQPVAVETHGPLSISTISFLVVLGRKISERTVEPLGVQFSCQRISVLVQRLNSVFGHTTFPVEDDADNQTHSHVSLLSHLVFNPWDLYLLGVLNLRELKKIIIIIIITYTPQGHKFRSGNSHNVSVNCRQE